MTTTSVHELHALAVAAEDDRFHEHYADRLAGSIDRATRRIEQACGDDSAAQVRRCREVMLALPASTLRQVVLHPLFNYYWLEFTDGLLRGDRRFVDSWDCHMPRFILGAPMDSLPASPGRWRVPIQDGGMVKLPANRYDLRVDGATETVTVSFAPDGDGVLRAGEVVVPPRFLSGDRGRDLGSVSLVPQVRLDALDVVVDAGDSWNARLLSSMNQRAGAVGYPDMDLAPLTDQPEQLCDQLDCAVRLIQDVWPEAAAEMARYLRLIVPYTSSFHSSFTESCTMGAVYLSEAMWPFSSLLYTAEHILHEVAHLRLTLVQELEILVEANPDATFNPPWRNDPRPLSGTLQGVFAFARMSGFHRRAFEVTGDPAHRERYEAVREQLRAGIAEIENEESVRLTDTGRQWWAGIREEAGLTE